MGCCAPKPVFIMSPGETGLLSLIDANRVPPTAHFPVIRTFSDILKAIEVVRVEVHDFKTLVVDALNGIERACHEDVCKRDFAGRWGRDGFTSFNVGFEVALADWRLLLDALDRLREERRMAILCLCHSKIYTYKNPEGPDFDRFSPDLHTKTWSLTHKWADHVLFLTFDTFVDTGKAKAKGLGGTRRSIHSERCAAWDAKNRAGLPARIDCGSSAGEAWSALANAMRTGRAIKSTSSEQSADVPQAELPQQ
jgi:hypothetical protein